MKGKDLLSIANLTAEELWRLLQEARRLKVEKGGAPLVGKTLALLFEKPSLRTRVSFEVAMKQLGGHAIYLSPSEVGMGRRETAADIAKVLSRYVDGIVARTYLQATVEELARNATIPVINGLSDEEHPCQALADLLTIYEKKGDLSELTLAFIGDGNNVASSLVLGASLVGLNFSIACPLGFEIKPAIWGQAEDNAEKSRSHLFRTDEPRIAAEGADILYTDVWVSMGQEPETEKRRLIFQRFQVNESLLAIAKRDALVMHPLPAHHGEEVAPGILESPASVVLDQAENRLHVQKAVLCQLLGAPGGV